MKSLRELGLTQYESAIYTALLETGKADAKTIAEQSKVPPTAVYPNLKSLIKKRIIQKSEGNPVLFEPLPPGQAIAQFVQQKERELKKLKANALEELKEIKPKKQTYPTQVISLTHGKELSQKVYLEALEKAQRTIQILGWKFSTVGDKYMLLHHFKKAHQRGVKIQIILTKSIEQKKQLIEDYKREGIQIKYLPLENFSLFIWDTNACKITLKSPELAERVNIQIEDKDLAKALHGYFNTQWEQAEAL